MRLHLVRHGRTVHNAEGRIQGRLLDDPLDDVGRAQVEALAAAYAEEAARGLDVAAVYASPLRRAMDTARAVARALGLPPPVALDGLAELDWGTHSGKLNEGAVRADMERVLAAWDAGDLDARTPGGERPSDVWARAAPEIATLASAHGEDTLVVVAHDRVNRVLASGLLHGHLHHMARYPQANAGVTRLVGPMPWRLAPDPRVSPAPARARPA